MAVTIYKNPERFDTIGLIVGYLQMRGMLDARQQKIADHEDKQLFEHRVDQPYTTANCGKWLQRVLKAPAFIVNWRSLRKVEKQAIN